MDTTLKKSAPAPKRGKIRPADIISVDRRNFDEANLTHLMEALARDGRFLHQITVRDEGANGYRLVSGASRLEAWKRHFGEQAPIPADIFPPDTSDAQIKTSELEENLYRKELSPAERQAGMLRHAATLKELEDEELATELPVSGSDAKSANRGGRGKKAATAKVAAMLGVSKTTVQNWTSDAGETLDEKIDLDRDSAEKLRRNAAELEKADKLQHVEPKGQQTARSGRIKIPSRRSKAHAGETRGNIEVARKAFDALDDAGKRQLAYYACLQIGVVMAPAVFGLDDEEPELAVDRPADVVPAIEGAAVDSQAEPQDDTAGPDAEALQDAGAAVSQAADAEAELATHLPAEVAPATDDSPLELQAEQQEVAADVGAKGPQDAGDDVPKPTALVIGAKDRCAHCNKPFLSSHLPRKKFGRFWHRGSCENHAKPIAIAA